MDIMDLVKELVQNLGVNEGAAKGGAGLIFKLAQDKLSGADFGKVSAAVPGIGDLMSAAPQSGGMLGSLAKMASGLGGDVGKLGGLASLADGFSKLGLDSGMVAKFLPIIFSFVGSKGGPALQGILEKVLK
jgi:hypothetical protein